MAFFSSSFLLVLPALKVAVTEFIMSFGRFYVREVAPVTTFLAFQICIVLAFNSYHINPTL